MIPLHFRIHGMFSIDLDSHLGRKCSLITYAMASIALAVPGSCMSPGSHALNKTQTDPSFEDTQACDAALRPMWEQSRPIDLGSWIVKCVPFRLYLTIPYLLSAPCFKDIGGTWFDVTEAFYSLKYAPNPMLPDYMVLSQLVSRLFVEQYVNGWTDLSEAVSTGLLSEFH